MCSDTTYLLLPEALGWKLSVFGVHTRASAHFVGVSILLPTALHTARPIILQYPGFVAEVADRYLLGWVGLETLEYRRVSPPPLPLPSDEGTGRQLYARTGVRFFMRDSTVDSLPLFRSVSLQHATLKAMFMFPIISHKCKSLPTVEDAPVRRQRPVPDDDGDDGGKQAGVVFNGPEGPPPPPRVRQRVHSGGEPLGGRRRAGTPVEDSRAAPRQRSGHVRQGELLTVSWLTAGLIVDSLVVENLVVVDSPVPTIPSTTVQSLAAERPIFHRRSSRLSEIIHRR